MTIRELYERFDITPGLQAHMFQVAQFADVVVKMWTGPAIDRDFLVKCALVHDLGNIVKFTEYFGVDALDQEHWERVKQAVITKYGDDDHEVTRRMLEAVQVDPEIIATVIDKSSSNAPVIAASDRWSLKILLYADLRIGPEGIISLKGRLEDLAKRSASHRNRPQVDAAIYEVERQLQEHASRDLQAILEHDFTLNKKEALATVL